MKKFNIITFILSLIAGIYVLISAYPMFVLVTVVIGITLGKALANTYMSFCIIYAIGGLISIVSAILCFKKSFLARIMLIISFTLTIILPIGIICINQTFELSNIPLFIPSIALLVAGLIGIRKSKEIDNPTGEKVNNE